MKKFIGVAVVSIILILSIYEINAEENAIRNAKIEILGIQIEEITLQYVKIKINISIVNNGSRDINELQGDFQIFILNISFGEAHLSKASVKAHSFYLTGIPLKIYYKGLAHGIANAIMEGRINVAIKGKITGKIFFGLLSYSQNIEAEWRWQ